MARLQILELPEGTGDDRPPFILVIDQAAESVVEGITASSQDIAEVVGARTVFAFEDTVEIPANDTAPVPVDSVEGDAQTGELIHAHEQTRLALRDALLLSLDTTWHQLIEQVAERQKTVARVLNLPEQPQAVSADRDMADYLHGYRIAIRDAKWAARTDRPQAAENGG